MWIMLKGSCDREDWSNGAENSALHLKNKYHQKQLNCNTISQYYCFSCILDQINAALVSIRDIFYKQKIFQI